jgi:myo-inositol 2-dehydrogenase / D-chiro-inositol 1-dehydrogenase
MSVGVGVIGAGVMGAGHARIIRNELSGAHLAAIADADAERARAAAAGAWATTNPHELIVDPRVEAVLVASPDETHCEFVVSAIKAGKPVLCEKPLAQTVADGLKIIEAERMAGRKLVHTGFMRRFDPAYRELKASIDSGKFGPVRMLHCQHRNAAAPAWFTAHMAVTNAFVHEIDVCRWLLGTEYRAVTVVSCEPEEKGAVADPLLITLEATNGVIVSTEVFMNAGYGYHVQVEAVCRKGAVLMHQPALIQARFDGAVRESFPENWMPRFADAYRLQDQAWIDMIRGSGTNGDAADSWDGLVATCIAEQVVQAMLVPGRTVLSLPSAN